MKSLYRPVIDYDEITTPTLPPNAYQDVNSPPDRPISLQVGGGSIIESIAPSESASLNVAMNRMVDSLVGPREPVVSEEEEEEEEQIVFTGRNKRSTPQKAKPQQPERSPITASNGSPQPRRAVQSEPAPPTSSPPPPSQPLPGTQKYVAPGSYTAKDLVNQLHNFTQRLTPNASPLAPRSQPPPPWREPYESSQPVSSIQAPSSFFYESSRNYVDSPSPFLYGSQWTHNTGTPPVAGQPYQSSQPNALG